MDAEQYCEILEEGVEESFETLEMAEAISENARAWYELPY